MYPTLIFADQTWSAVDLQVLADRISARLNALGVRGHEAVAVMMRNCPEYAAAVIACRRAGVYLVSINWHFKALEAGYILEDSGAKVLLCHEDLVAQIAEGIPDSVELVGVPCRSADGSPRVLDWLLDETAEPLPERSDVPFNSIVYTSGTTGKPKGVRRLPVPAGSPPPSVAGIAATVYGVDSDSVALLSAPLYHSATMSYLVHCCSVGATLVLESRFDAERTLKLIDRYRVSHAYLVPTMYQRLLALPPKVRTRYNVDSLRQVSSTGSPCPEPLKRQMIEWFGPIITEGYGSTEAGYTTFINSHEWLRKPGSAGRALHDAEIVIVDDAGRELPANEVGLIYVRQPAMPDFTYIGRETDRAAIGRHGLVTLGDMGFLDDDGYLYICDRKADMIISGGVNIYPAEIESVLMSIPEIADAAVFGVPDEEFGESIAAAVQLVPDAQIEARDIQEYVRSRIAAYKVPRNIVFHEQLPREETGKIRKRQLRHPYWETLSRRV